MQTKRPNILRQQSNEVEKSLWGLLRDRRFLGYKFRRQVSIGPYIADFICYKKRLIIEADGSQHNQDAQQIYDQKRSEYLAQQKFRIIRFWNHDILNNKEAVLTVLLRALEE